MNLIQIQYKMDTIFRNSKKIKTCYPRSLVLSLSDKMKLKRSDKYVALSNCSKYYIWKNIKKSYNKNIEFKIATVINKIQE